MNIVSVSQPIVRNYLNLVQAGTRKISEVPEQFRDEISQILGLTIENAITAKIEEMSAACEATIVAGMDVEMSIGTQHFSFTGFDQADIKNWFDVSVLALKNGADPSTAAIPYHSDDQVCQIYTYLDIINLYKAEQGLILYHKTYFNTLKSMIKALTTIEEVQAVIYGVELTGDYLTQMNEILTQGNTAFETAMEMYGLTTIAE